MKAIERRKRRPLPSDLHAPATDPTARVVAGDPELTWLQPARFAAGRHDERPGHGSGCA